MRSGRRWMAALLGAAVVVTGGGPAASEPRHLPAGDELRTPDPVDRVVVVGVAGLRWDDVDTAGTPHLARAAASGSTGSLSVRSALDVTCPSEGWLTLGAGGYAAVRDAARIDPRRGCAGRPVPVPWPTGAGTSAVVPSVAALNDRLRFDAVPGWLVGQVGCVTAVGPGAATAAADRDGAIAHYSASVPDGPGAVTALVDDCPATLVDAGTLPEGAGRAAAVGRVDALVGAVRAGAPERTVVMVLGVAETTGDRGRLHVAVIEGPGFGPGWLTSGSTRRPPYVQLADVAPTVASLLGGPTPDEVAGRPITHHPQDARRPRRRLPSASLRGRLIARCCAHGARRGHGLRARRQPTTTGIAHAPKAHITPGRPGRASAARTGSAGSGPRTG